VKGQAGHLELLDEGSMGGAGLASGLIKGRGLQLHHVDGTLPRPPPPGRVFVQEARHHRAPGAVLQVQTTAWVKGSQRCWSKVLVNGAGQRCWSMVLVKGGQQVGTLYAPPSTHTNPPAWTLAAVMVNGWSNESMLVSGNTGVGGWVGCSRHP
jgi:hypothetical protein